MLDRETQAEVIDASRKVDLFLWIKARDGTLQHLTPNEAKFQKEALDLFSLPPTTE
jgi:hypothetical protein